MVQSCRNYTPCYCLAKWRYQYCVFCQVVIRDGENQTYEFPCDRWLSESEDDGQISRDLIVMNGGSDFMPIGILIPWSQNFFNIVLNF